MKKLFALGAVSIMLAGTAFAACPCKIHQTWAPAPNCNRVSYVQYEQPIIPCPVAKQDPCCCKKQGFMGKIWDGTKSAYDMTFGNVFGMLSGR